MSLSSSVCPSGVILFSLEHSKHLKQDVLKELQGCLWGVCLKFKESLDVSRMFQGSLNGVNRKFQGSLMGVSRKFQEYFKKVSGKFQWCFKKVPSLFK